MSEGRRPMTKGRRWASTALACAAMTLAAIAPACSSTEERSYDIGPIFPSSEDKCAKYDGEESGEGFTKSCMVTKSNCERAAADWREAMSENAVDFICD